MLFTLLFLSTSCLNQEDGKYIPGVNGPKVNVQDGKILLTVELENIEMQGGLTLPISKKMKNSNITLGPAMHDDGTWGGTMIKVAFDLKDVENDHFKVVSPETLPDGRDFPFMVNGKLPSLAFHVPKAKDATFYVSKKAFGFFLPVKIPEDFRLDVYYRIKVNGKNYGVVQLMHKENADDQSGVIVLLSLDEVRKDKGLQKLMKMSKRAKSRVF